MNERVMELLQYLDRLSTLNEGGYRCNDEIGECIGWVREELKPYEDVTNCTVCGQALEYIELATGDKLFSSSVCGKCRREFNKD